MKAQRFAENPIIYPEMDERIGNNINGPSLIRVPGWIQEPLGRYYLYFAHHGGDHLRLAYANDLHGPWQIHAPGVLDLANSHFGHHIASPDVHVRSERGEIWMYYHGCCQEEGERQVTRLAVSTDGLHFSVRPEILGASYFRVFEWHGWFYALALAGKLYRSRDGMTNWTLGPGVFPPSTVREISGVQTTCGMRHSAVRVETGANGDTLHVWYSNRCDAPERILHTAVALTDDWSQWQPSEPTEVLRPELAYEGIDAPRVPSLRGPIHEPAWQLRDPAIYEEDGRLYLLYSVAGEQGIAAAELVEDAN